MGETLRLACLNIGYYGGLFAITTIGVFVCAGPGYLWLRFVRKLPTPRCMRMLIWHYGKAWGKLTALFVPFRLIGCDQPLPDPCILTPNHQSFFDAYCIGLLQACNVVYAVRAWPFRIPVYRPFMSMAEYINTEAVNGDELLRRGLHCLKQGASIIIFPEGTRSPDGSLQRFHAGAFRLADAAQAPVVPLCIEGTGRFLKKGQWLVRPTTITIKVLEPIHPGDFAAFGEEAPLRLRRAVKEALRHALEQHHIQGDVQ